MGLFLEGAFLEEAQIQENPWIRDFLKFFAIAFINQMSLSSHPRGHATRSYGIKGTEVDQSCFINPVKWIKGLDL